MRVLLDECIDRRYARELHGYFIRTVPQLQIVLPKAKKRQATFISA
jgi:hypothetical protein